MSNTTGRTPCSFPGCTSRRESVEGLCIGHKYQLRKGKQLTPLYRRGTASALIRSWVANRDRSSGCWDDWPYAWSGERPIIHKTRVARIAFELATGVRPNIACHRCDNPRCVNPDHIYNGDKSSNYHDYLRAKRGASF